MANIYYDIGRCFGSLNQFEKSFNHLEYSLIMNKKDDDANLKSKIYNIKGFNYYRLKEYKKAIKAYSKAKECAEGLDDFEKKSAFAYNNIGEVYIEMEDYKSAKKHFEKALFFKRNLGDSELVAGTLINMAKLALLENQPSKSITYLEEIIQLLDKDRFSNNLSEASVLLTKAYKHKKDLTQKDVDKIMAPNEQYARHINDLKQEEVRQSMISTLSKSKLENETLYLQEKVEKQNTLNCKSSVCC